MLEALWRTPPKLPLPGCTMIILDPICPISSRMLCLDPAPMASMEMTEATPIMIPSMVRKALILLFVRALKAIKIKFL